MIETEAQRTKRRSQRVLFDAVADLYDSTRRGYPTQIVEYMVATAGVGAGDAVLEVGCGTGQLTRQLPRFGFVLMAIDISPSMISVARRHLADVPVSLASTSFEAFDAPDRSLALIVSATAFHWVDPDLAWSKAARLLRPGGWLALLETGERYDDPLGPALMELWINHSADGGAWAKEKKPTLAETIADTGLFRQAATRSHTKRMTLPAGAVLGLEQTRATTLSYDDSTRQSFISQLRALLEAAPEVRLEQQTSLTMAQVAPDP